MKVKIFKKDSPPCKGLILVLLAAYFVILAWVIIFKCNVNGEMHVLRNQSRTLWERMEECLYPFQSTVRAFATQSPIGIIEFFFNLIVFIPFGILFRFLTNTRATLISAALTTLAVEVFQLFSGWGGPDPTDLIMNFGGALLGVHIYRLLRPKIKDYAVNIAACCCLLVAVPVAVFAIVNSIIHFPV